MSTQVLSLSSSAKSLSPLRRKPFLAHELSAYQKSLTVQAKIDEQHEELFVKRHGRTVASALPPKPFSHKRTVSAPIVTQGESGPLLPPSFQKTTETVERAAGPAISALTQVLQHPFSAPIPRVHRREPSDGSLMFAMDE